MDPETLKIIKNHTRKLIELQTIKETIMFQEKNLNYTSKDMIECFYIGSAYGAYKFIINSSSCNELVEEMEQKSMELIEEEIIIINEHLKRYLKDN